MSHLKTANLRPSLLAICFCVLEIHRELGNVQSGSRSALRGNDLVGQMGKGSAESSWDRQKGNALYGMWGVCTGRTASFHCVPEKVIHLFSKYFSEALLLPAPHSVFIPLIRYSFPSLGMQSHGPVTWSGPLIIYPVHTVPGNNDAYS